MGHLAFPTLWTRGCLPAAACGMRVVSCLVTITMRRWLSSHSVPHEGISCPLQDRASRSKICLCESSHLVLPLKAGAAVAKKSFLSRCLFLSKWDIICIPLTSPFGVPPWLSSEEFVYSVGVAGVTGLIPGWKISWRRQWRPTPVLLPGESLGQKTLAGYSHEVPKSQTQLK